MWNPKWDGLPSQRFLSSVDPLLDGIREKLGGEYHTSEVLAGHLSAEWAEKMGLRAGIPIPVGRSMRTGTPSEPAVRKVM